MGVGVKEANEEAAGDVPGSACAGEILPPLTGGGCSGGKGGSMGNNHKKVEAGGLYAGQHPPRVLLENEAVLLLDEQGGVVLPGIRRGGGHPKLRAIAAPVIRAAA
eukprot:11478206-Prorocentrum_lima.AAC.1